MHPLRSTATCTATGSTQQFYEGCCVAVGYLVWMNINESVNGKKTRIRRSRILTVIYVEIIVQITVEFVVSGLRVF